jgi:hypothetical protein
MTTTTHDRLARDLRGSEVDALLADDPELAADLDALPLLRDVAQAARDLYRTAPAYATVGPLHEALYAALARLDAAR